MDFLVSPYIGMMSNAWMSLSTWFVCMGRQTQIGYSLSPHWSSGEDFAGISAPHGSSTSLVTYPPFTYGFWRQEVLLRIDVAGGC